MWYSIFEAIINFNNKMPDVKKEEGVTYLQKLRDTVLELNDSIQNKQSEYTAVLKKASDQKNKPEDNIEKVREAELEYLLSEIQKLQAIESRLIANINLLKC